MDWKRNIATPQNIEAGHLDMEGSNFVAHSITPGPLTVLAWLEAQSSLDEPDWHRCTRSWFCSLVHCSQGCGRAGRAGCAGKRQT